ncbi:Gas vesicle protein [Planococcus glaciei]|uniref:YkuS family protein n=1 Tax=Planococcus glaciei TaxID=459472 RepID=UPI00088CDB8A|nr:YkuS family protein [Planococcus glaciei]SDG71909.1 Gas vesicle protein [Planococcus glaciei]
MVKIAVEEPFTSVKEALQKRGYEAEMLGDKTEAMDYDCVVVRDKEDLTDFHMNVPLVEAKGRTLEEIVDEVEERLVRIGKIPAPPSSGGITGSSFLKGAATGAIVGAAAGLLLTPKSGKEMQAVVKEKTSDTKEKLGGVTEKAKGTVGQVKEKTSGVTEKAKGTLGQAKEKTSGVTSTVKEKVKGPVDNLKAKRQEMQETKELKKQEKVVKQEAKAEEKAQKEHEKAEKQAEKEIKKAEKESSKEKGSIEVVELGDADVTTNASGGATIVSTEANKNNKK